MKKELSEPKHVRGGGRLDKRLVPCVMLPSLLYNVRKCTCHIGEGGCTMLRDAEIMHYPTNLCRKKKKKELMDTPLRFMSIPRVTVAPYGLPEERELFQSNYQRCSGQYCGRPSTGEDRFTSVTSMECSVCDCGVHC